MSIDHSSPYKSLAGKRTYTVEEIAKILGIGLPLVKYRIKRAKELLAVYLGTEEMP